MSDYELIENGYKWNTTKFFIGLINRIFNIIFSREFVVFVIVTVMKFSCLNGSMSEPVFWIGYYTVAIVFILAEALKILITQKTTMSINANANFGLNKEIKGTN